MARRTKKQKQIAALKRQLNLVRQNKLKAAANVKNNTKKEVITKTSGVGPLIKPKKTEVFFYDPSFIKKDLQKTLLVSAAMIVILGTIYYLNLQS